MVCKVNKNHLTKSKKALFLDRDGVLINYIPYLSKPEQVNITPGAGEALKKWQDEGYLLIIITNQSGIGRGYFSLSDVEAIHARIRKEYEQFGVSFQDILICPHHPSDGCKCRKPSPHLLQEASKKHLLEISESFFIGDAPSDIDCAIKANCNPVLVLTGRGEATAKQLDKPIPIFDSLKDTVDLIDN
ncbi:MAG: HAD family hydrolase [Moorea sp. SIO2B7]|nr:HAD family hydrolase [Moorena sp. SIO2B7]